jgi:S-(hydroxymethyl)glutathione dehydrogenase / alcohol dehydrogenase
VPKLVNKVILGELKLDDYITHVYEGLEEVNKSIDVLHSGACLRAVVKINKAPEVEAGSQIKVLTS